MPKILSSILFVCIAVGVVFIVFDNNTDEQNASGNQSLSSNQKQIGNEGGIQQSIPDLNKQQVKQSLDQVLTAAEINFIPTQDGNIKLLEAKLDALDKVEKEQSIVNPDESISLWEIDAPEEFEEDTTIEHEERIKTRPEVLAQLQVGQVLDFFIPQLGETFQSEITSTSNQLGNVKVWKGDILNEEQEKSNFIMTQGAVMTNVVLSTAEGVYTVYIDNETGEGTVIDDREYTSRMSDTDDSVPYHKQEME
jgi:hypothetical protein